MIREEKKAAKDIIQPAIPLESVTIVLMKCYQ